VSRVVALFTALLLCAALAAPASAATPTPAMRAAAQCQRQSFALKARPATHEVVKVSNIKVKMSDGVRLVGDLYKPSGKGPWPTIVTTTPYSKDALGPEEYFPQRGYAHFVADIRGTGASNGQWQVLGPREARDVAEIVEWAGHQRWSNGKLGMYGASYLAITQLLGAARHPKGLKALFPIVPMADSYRDISYVGGQTNLAFIPIWMGLVTGTGLLPNQSWFTDTQYAAASMAAHLAQLGSVQGPLVAGGTTGGDPSYDTAWYHKRAPIRVADKIKIPVFMSGGLNDLFQRGEPLLYERLKDNTLTKFVQGPWGHLDGSSGAGLPRDGVPAYLPTAVQWFDRWVRGVHNGAECFPDVTMYHWGSERYERVADWPHPRLAPQRRFLRADGFLSTRRPGATEAADVMPQIYGNGTCSRSTSQWLMGAIDRTPCQTDNRTTEAAELTYTTEPFAEAVHLNGPIAAKLWVSTTAREAVVVSRLTAVAPDGRSRELSTGLLAASFRTTDRRKSRVVDGMNIQPWHPYSRKSVHSVTPGRAMPLNIEIFPTAARLPKGWSLRLTVGTSDFPHAVSPLPMAAAQQGGVLSVLHDKAHPSSVAIPYVGAADGVRPGVHVVIGRGVGVPIPQ
jgi:putative CocE/NonD family hydrolase